MSKWRDYGKQGGRPRTKPTITIDGIEMSLSQEQRRNTTYYYGIYTDAQGRKQRRYLGTDLAPFLPTIHN